MIFYIFYLESYSLFLGFYVSFYLFFISFLAAHKWFVNPVLAIRPVCSLLVLLCHCIVTGDDWNAELIYCGSFPQEL